jgi:hypothetical protein
MPTPEPGQAWTGQQLAELLNEEFHSYNPDNASSGIGIFLRFAENEQIFCGGQCFEGKPDCKVSGCILNDKQMMYHNNGSVAFTFGKATGWYINTTKIRTKLGKCSFAYDGGTDAKYNGGCGCHADSGSCDDDNCAYKNKCGGKTCTNMSEQVKSCACANQPASQWPTSWEEGTKCYWKGPAWYPGANAPDETHGMLDQRVKYQSKKGAPPHNNSGDNYIQWNEMVLDGKLLVEELRKDPAATLPAIVYIPDVHGEQYAITAAKTLAKNFAKAYPSSVRTTIPLIKVDTKVDASKKDSKPFVFENVYSDDQLVI